MSFIYDDEKLLYDLMISGFDKKVAQVATNAKINVEYQNLLNLSTKLVDQLKAQYSPEAKDPDASEIKATSEQGPKIVDLNTLGNFLGYCVQNGVTVNGAPVAYPSEGAPPTLNKKEYLGVNAETSQLAIETVDQDGNRQATSADFYVHKDLLKRYLTDLSSQIPKADQETQKLMRALLGGLMETVNRVFKLQLTPDYKKPDEKFLPTTNLDDIPNPFDPKNPYQDGNTRITVADLQSPGQFNAWSGKQTLILADGAKVTIKDANWDRCYFINGLYARAGKRARDAIPADESRMAYYVKLVEQLAAKMECKLSGPSKPTEPGNKPKVNPQAIARVMSVLPFKIKDVDFDRYELFFKTVEPLLAHDSTMVSTIQETRQLMQETSNRYIQNDLKIIPLGITVNQFARMMKNKEKPGTQTLNAADALDRIIDNTRTVVNGFQNAYAENLGDNERGLLAGQIGKNPTSSSVYSGNAEEVAELRGTPSISPGNGSQNVYAESLEDNESLFAGQRGTPIRRTRT